MVQTKYGPPCHKSKPYSIMLELETQANKKLISEYSNDILKTLAHLEGTSQVNPSMIELQPEIQWFMRPFLLDFLIELHSSFKLQPQTLFLCLNIIDRYCAKRIVFKRHYQLVGCTALWIAGKYEDKKSRVPTLKELTIMCRSAYDEEMFIQMEMHILSTLEWSLSHPNLEDCLQLAITNSNISTTPYKTSPSSSTSAISVVARFLCELSLYDKFFLAMPTSLLSTTANLLACSMLQIPNAATALKELVAKSKKKQLVGTLYCNDNSSNYSHNQFKQRDSFGYSDSENEDEDDQNENSLPAVHGAFLSGLDENALSQIKRIALMFIIQLSKVTEVLSKKYEPLGVIQVINNFHSRYTFIIQNIYESQQEVSSDSVDSKLLQMAEVLLQFPSFDDFEQPSSMFNNNTTPFNSSLSLDTCLPPPVTPPSASSQYSVFSNKRSSSVCVTPIHAPNPNTSNITNSGDSILRKKSLRVSKNPKSLHTTSATSLISRSSQSTVPAQSYNHNNNASSPISDGNWSSPIMHV